MRNFVSTLLLTLVCGYVIAQTTVSGIIMDESNNEPLIGANVMNVSTLDGTITDLDGKFTIEVPESSGSLEVSFVGYKTVTITFESSGGAYNLGSIGLPESSVGLEEVVITGTMDIVQDRRTPVAVSTIGLAEIQAKSVGNVEFPEVMKNTPSIYVSNQTGFGDSQMFTRGFNQINTAFLLNGQPINGMEDGRMYWSNWSGMSDVASAVQIQRGLGSSKLAISSVGGTINIVTKTIDNNQGGYARFMVGNDGYLKGTFSYSSGLKGKWAYTFLLDHWQANNKWAEGTKGQGQNYFLSVGYKPDDKNTFNFLVTGAPQWHGQRWSQRVETLEATPKFNQHWGEYDGEWESERRNFYHKPVLNLSWDNQISDNSFISSVLYASFGRGGGTGPFGSSSNRVRTADGQVDFDAIEANNLADSDGLGSFSGNYAIRASMNNHQWYGNVTKYETQLNDQLNWSIGADFRWYTGDHFRQFANLLGLNGWQDSFRHATRGRDEIQSESFNPGPWTALFNFASEDQRIAYDYSEQINYQGGFTQLEYANDAFTMFVQGALSNQSYQREGRWADQGKSDKVSKVGYNIKGGASVSINNNNIIFANAGVYSRQPYLDNIFSNIRYSNEMITTGNGDGVDNEEIVGIEAGYKYNNNNFQFSANAYSTSWGNRTRVFAFNNENGTPDDESDDFAQRTVERGLAQIHTGFELDARYRVNDFTLKGFASFGNWEFDGIESVQTFNDDTGVELSNQSGIDNSGVHIPNAPQTSYGIGLNYNAAGGFSAYLDYNRFNNLYINNINFDSGNQFLTSDQGTLDPYGIVDFGIGYTIDMGGNLMTLRGNIYNLLDAEYLNQTDPFGFLNGNGRTFNLSAKYSFIGSRRGAASSGSSKTMGSKSSVSSGKMDSDGDGIKDSKDLCPAVVGERKFKGCPMEYNAYMAQLKAEEEARIKSEMEAKAKAEKAARLKAEMEAKAAAEGAAKAAEAAAKAEEEARLKAEIEAKVKAEAAAKAAAARAETIRARNAELTTKFTAALRGLQFNSAQSSFKKSSYSKMDEAVAILSQYSDIKILIQGHTDSQGDAEKNRSLSQKRADAVKEYLMSKGIDSSRMITNGLGEDNPIADNNSAEGRAMNRRVEFIILR